MEGQITEGDTVLATFTCTPVQIEKPVGYHKAGEDAYECTIETNTKTGLPARYAFVIACTSHEPVDLMAALLRRASRYL